MKTKILLICMGLAQVAHPQVTTPTVRALFGVDADVRANYLNNAGADWNDDWFNNGTCCGGTHVIDTTGAAAWINLYNSNVQSRRRSFVKKMSQPLYSVVTSRLWYDALMVRDHHAQDTTAFAVSNKNGQSPALWQGGVQPIPMKDDIKDVMVHVRRAGPELSDSLYFLAALSLEGTTGNRYFDFELYQTEMFYDPVSATFKNVGPDAGHTSWLFDAAGNVIQAGDIIFTAEFSSSTLSNLEARIWIHNSSLSKTPATFSWGGAFDGDGNSAVYGYASILPKAGGQFYSGMQNGAATWAGPFGYVDISSGVTTNYTSGQLMEIAVNLTKMGLDPYSLTALSNACGLPFKRLFAKTRSATSFTAELKDFVGPYAFLSPEHVSATTDLAMFCGYYYQVSTLSVSNPIATSTYEWRTTNGHILTYPATGTSISVDAPGTYIVTQTLYMGCGPYSSDTITLSRMPGCILLEQNDIQISALAEKGNASLYMKITDPTATEVILERNTGNGFSKAASFTADQLLPGFAYNDNIEHLPGNTVAYRLKVVAENNNISYSRIVFVNLASRKSVLSIQPNPVLKSMVVYLPANITTAGLRISDAAGRTVMSRQVQPVTEISMATLPKGIYFLHIDYGNGLWESRKIVKE